MNTKGTEALQFIQVFFTVFRFRKLMCFLKNRIGLEKAKKELAGSIEKGATFITK